MKFPKLKILRGPGHSLLVVHKTLSVLQQIHKFNQLHLFQLEDYYTAISVIGLHKSLMTPTNHVDRLVLY